MFPSSGWHSLSVSGSRVFPWPPLKVSGSVVACANWFAFVIVGTVVVVLWRQDKRPLKGHCRTCSYNLTGNESGVCPECATPVKRGVSDHG